jgi:hypothetical protein
MSQRDCQCIAHVGPHWLYDDFLSRERNLDLFERLIHDVETQNAHDFPLALEAWTREEQMRLAGKEYHIRCEEAQRGERGAYPYSLLGIPERVEQFEHRWSALVARLARVRVPGQPEEAIA